MYVLIGTVLEQTVADNKQVIYTIKSELSESNERGSELVETKKQLQKLMVVAAENEELKTKYHALRKETIKREMEEGEDDGTDVLSGRQNLRFSISPTSAHDNIIKELRTELGHMHEKHSNVVRSLDEAIRKNAYVRQLEEDLKMVKEAAEIVVAGTYANVV